jgi:hypothetical protein
MMEESKPYDSKKLLLNSDRRVIHHYSEIFS